MIQILDKLERTKIRVAARKREFAPVPCAATVSGLLVKPSPCAEPNVGYP
jgi:hypothetical protein